MVRGFWGDIVNSPFISFGLELNTKEEHDHFHKNNMINYIYDSQEVTEYNLIKILMKMDKNEDYDYTIREKERNQIQTESTIDKNPTEMASGSNNEPMNSDNTLNDSVTMDYSLIASEPMIGFKNIRLIPLSGSLENILKKKKYRNLFDFIIIGLHSKCFVDKAKEILSPEGKVFIELNT